jgi:hypothetical protein
MLKKLILALAVLLQLGVFSVTAVNADELPEPTCFPCAR